MWSVDVISLIEYDIWLVVGLEVNFLLRAALTLVTRAFATLLRLWYFFPNATSAPDILLLDWHAVEMLVVLLELLNDLEFIIELL